VQLDPDVHILNSGKAGEARVKKRYQIVVGRKRSSQHEVMGASEYADIGNGVEGSQLVDYGVLIADPRTEAYEHRNVLFIVLRVLMDRKRQDLGLEHVTNTVSDGSFANAQGLSNFNIGAFRFLLEGVDNIPVDVIERPCHRQSSYHGWLDGVDQGWRILPT
jgi:hypothetical protein